MKEKKQKVLIWFIKFMAFMLVCTVISRGIYARNMPQVSVDRCESKNLTQQIEADGRICAGMEHAVVTLEGLRVATVNVKEGEMVQEGDTLFTVDLDDLQKILDTQKNNLKVEQQKLATLQDNQNQKNADKSNAIDRASADVDTVSAQQQSIIAGLQQEYDQTVATLATYTSWDEYMAATDAENPMTESEWSAAKEAAENQVAEKASALTTAKADSDNAILAAQRALEDAQKPVEEDSSIAEVTAAIEKIQETIADYEKIAETEGVVTSNSSATITKINVSTGERTVDGAAMVLEDGSDGWMFTANVTREQQQLISAGDTVSVSFKKENIEIEDATVESVIEAEDGTYDINVNLDEKDLSYGMSGSLKVIGQSESYDCCVPLSALYADNHKNYVLVLREKQTILGTELVAARVDVDVLDKSSEYAALKDNPITQDDRLITSSTKGIQSGDKVRLIEQ